jgi:hypothetical protein
MGGVVFCRAATIKKEIRPVKAAHSVFTDLSASVQEWKWPPPPPSVEPRPSDRGRGALTATCDTRDSSGGGGAEGIDGYGQCGDDQEKEEEEEEEEKGTEGTEGDAVKEREKVIRAKVQRALEKRNLKALTRDSAHSQRQVPDKHTDTSTGVAVDVLDYSYNISQEEVDPNIFTELSSSRLVRVQSSLQQPVPSSVVAATTAALGQSGSSQSRSGQKLNLHPTIVLKRLSESAQALSPPKTNTYTEQPLGLVRMSSSQFMRGATTTATTTTAHRQDHDSTVGSMYDTRNQAADVDLSYDGLSVHDLAALSNEAFLTQDFGAGVSATGPEDADAYGQYEPDVYEYARDGDCSGVCSPMELSMEGNRGPEESRVNRMSQRGGEGRRVVSDDGFMAALEREMEVLEHSASSPAPSDRSSSQHRLKSTPRHSMHDEEVPYTRCTCYI